MKKDTFASLSEKYNLVTKATVADGYFQNYTTPIFIKNPEIQGSVPILLPAEKFEKINKKLEDFLVKLDAEYRKELEKEADRVLKRLLKAVPDFSFGDETGTPSGRQEYTTPVTPEEIGPKEAE